MSNHVVDEARSVLGFGMAIQFIDAHEKRIWTDEDIQNVAHWLNQETHRLAEKYLSDSPSLEDKKKFVVAVLQLALSYAKDEIKLDAKKMRWEVT